MVLIARTALLTCAFYRGGSILLEALAAHCHILERRHNVLVQLQGSGAHFRPDLVGFVCLSLARHNSPVPGDFSTPTS
jgi:hypothetical protein